MNICFGYKVVILWFSKWHLSLSILTPCLKSLTIHQQTWSFLHLCKLLRHYKSLTPSKSMPQKSNHNFKEKYHYVRTGTIEPKHIKHLEWKPAFENVSKAHNDIKIGKEVKMIKVVVTSLHSLSILMVTFLSKIPL